VIDLDKISSHDITLIDIAVSLARQSRYLGHTRYVYTVAQHSVIVSRACPGSIARHGLLHDAAEAFIGDIVRPVKMRIPGDVIVDLENRVLSVIADWAGIDFYGFASVKQYDDDIIERELFSFYRVPLAARFTSLAPIIPVSGAFSFTSFLNEFDRLDFPVGQLGQRAREQFTAIVGRSIENVFPGGY
jgi:hypothetical protein